MTKAKKEISKHLDHHIIELQKQIDDLKRGWQRTQADFENYQKRVENDRLENLAFTKAEFVLRLTPVLDNFQRAFSLAPHHKTDRDWVSGIKQIEKQLEDILSDEGSKRIETGKGTKFDPNFHEAISYEESDLPVDEIIAELESGWQFNDKVIKPAKVRVSKGK